MVQEIIRMVLEPMHPSMPADIAIDQTTIFTLQIVSTIKLEKSLLTV